jgi:hypothetical protein
MKNPTNREVRAARDADFALRLQPRLIWDSNAHGTYRRKPIAVKVHRKLTEAQDNAIGRALRRRQNKRLRGWLPYAKR